MAGKNRKENIQIQHPLKQLKRLMSYVFRDYGIHCIAVLILIVVSVLANVQGTMFTRTLIDEYIQPLLLSDRPDFAPLLHAIIRVAAFYGIGIVSTYTYNRLMVEVTQEL